MRPEGGGIDLTDALLIAWAAGMTLTVAACHANRKRRMREAAGRPRAPRMPEGRQTVDHTTAIGRLTAVSDRWRGHREDGDGITTWQTAHDALEALEAIQRAMLPGASDWTPKSCERLSEKIAELIEGAWKEGFDEGFASADDWMAENEKAMREHGWVRADDATMQLPVDADGRPIRVGDMVDCGEYFGVREVEGFVHRAVAFTVFEPQPTRICTCPAWKVRHVDK